MTDPITALREVPTLLTPERLERARTSTHTRIDQLATRRRRRWPALALVATAAAAIATVVSFGDTPTHRPEVATAKTVLNELADHVAAQPVLNPGEYYAVRVVQREAAHPAKALDLRYWEDAAGDGREVAILDGKLRKDVALGTPDPRVPNPVAPPKLSEFPTDPAGVAKRMRELARGPEGPVAEPTTRDYVVAAMQMITDQRSTPPEVLRAIFRFLSAQPGMRLIGDVTDPLGRPGKAVAANGDPQIHEGIGVELIVNPDTGRPLAMIHYRDGDVNQPWLQTIRQEGVVKGDRALPD